MNRISHVLVAAPLALSLFVAPLLTGCAADGDGTDAESTEQDLTPSASTLVGNWTPAPGVDIVEADIFFDLNLAADGTFKAHRETDDACAQAEGIDCTALEGTWKARKYQSGIRLYLTIGARTDRYEAKRDGELLTLTDSEGRPQTLQPGEARVDGTEGEACGSIRCETGTVCCNPVSEICAPPGYACAQ